MGEKRREEREKRGPVWFNALFFIDFFDCFQSECFQELHRKADKMELLLLKVHRYIWVRLVCPWSGIQRTTKKSLVHTEDSRDLQKITRKKTKKQCLQNKEICSKIISLTCNNYLRSIFLKNA